MIFGQGQGAGPIEARFPFKGWRNHHQIRIQRRVIAPPTPCIKDGWMGRMGGIDDSLGCPSATPFGQLPQQLVAGTAAQLEQHKGILTEAIAHKIINSADMFAGICLIWATAFTAHLLQFKREKTLTTGGESPLDILGHDASQKLGRPTCLLAEGFEHIAPIFIIENIQPQLHLVGILIRSLDAGMDPATLKADRKHVAISRIGPGTLEAFLIAKRMN